MGFSTVIPIIYYSSIIFALVLASARNDKFKTHNPEYQTYMWGYFLSIGYLFVYVFFPLTVIILFSIPPMSDSGFPIETWLEVLISQIILLPIAWGVYSRYRIGWILMLLYLPYELYLIAVDPVMQMSTFKLIAFITSIVYLKNRWNELKTVNLMKIKI